MRLGGLRTWLLLLVLVATAPGLALVVREHAEDRERQDRTVVSTAVDLARAAAAAEQAKLDGAKGFVLGLAELPSVKAHDADECSRVFATLSARYPAFSNFGAATPDGWIFCSGKSSASDPKQIADREYFRRALATRAPSVGEYVIGRKTGAPSIHVAAPSLGRDGKVVAVVYAGLDLRAMSARLERFPAPAGATLTVLDRRGTVLAASPPASAHTGAPAQAAGLASALRTPEGVSEGPGLDGAVRVHGHVSASLSGSEPDLVVIGGVARATPLDPREAMRHRTTIAYAVVLLGGLALAWLIGDLVLVRRLERLGAVARRLSGGDLAARAGSSSGDEIGALARTFDEMAAAVEGLARQNRLILESAGVGIYGVTVDGVITVMNPAAAAMLGCTPAAAIGRDAHQLLHGAASACGSTRRRCPVVAALADGEIQRGDGDVLQRADGSTFPVEFVATPIREGDAIVGAVVTFRDITERRQLEAQLRQAHKMEAVGRLAGGVAHDFNNLLTVVLSIGELLADELPTDHPLRPEVAELVSAGRRGADLTRQLLAFGRKQVLAPVPLDPGSVVHGLKGLLQRLIGEHVRIETQLGATGRVLADRGQLEQVIVNLVLNARDAMPRGGVITLQTADADRTAGAHDGFDTPPGRYVLLSVADTGTGMDEHTVSRLFEPFFTTKAPSLGTGLGLSTVYGIVKQSGGDIRVESAVGSGSRFEILLPRCEVAVTAGEVVPFPATGARARGERLLVVEDNPLVRAVTCRTLASAGYEVVAAASTEEALRLATAGDPVDLVVMDVILPGLNGRELAGRLQRERPALKVLFVSGYTNGANVVGLPEGVFLQKPFTPRDLLCRVGELLGPGPTDVASGSAI